MKKAPSPAMEKAPWTQIGVLTSRGNEFPYLANNHPRIREDLERFLMFLIVLGSARAERRERGGREKRREETSTRGRLPYL